MAEIKLYKISVAYYWPGQKDQEIDKYLPLSYHKNISIFLFPNSVFPSVPRTGTALLKFLNEPNEKRRVKAANFFYFL